MTPHESSKLRQMAGAWLSESAVQCDMATRGNPCAAGRSMEGQSCAMELLRFVEGCEKAVSVESYVGRVRFTERERE